MKTLKIYDPAMCCSSGVCGPDVDTELVQFANLLRNLDSTKVNVERYNLSQEPAAFVAEPLVKETLAQEGNGCLPLILVDGELISKGKYPAGTELMQWLGLDVKATPEEVTPSENTDSDCGAGCDCNSPSPENKKMKTIASSLVLVAVLGILGFKVVQAEPATESDVSTGTTAAFAIEQIAAVPAPTEPSASSMQALKTLNDLNTVALSYDAVLVFIPAVGNAALPEATTTAIQTTRETLKKSNLELGMFMLPESAEDYATIAEQANPPSILMAVKGGGMLMIPAETTESQLLQAFMAASSGGCGAGCGPSGCH
ncbi:arsenite efflux transporter metallochaperone ArsD [Pontiellaceae bacterium B12219]|nr:arsenite efflux transporter metallochaperone ArsD [Pontiellaceae bacterium B12219]